MDTADKRGLVRPSGSGAQKPGPGLSQVLICGLLIGNRWSESSKEAPHLGMMVFKKLEHQLMCRVLLSCVSHEGQLSS